MKKLFGVLIALAVVFAVLPALAATGSNGPENRESNAPNVALTRLQDGDTVKGVVYIHGSVLDANPDHYWAIVSDADGNIVAGPGRVNSRISFTDKALFLWDTLTVPDGQYTVTLSSRDAFGNKDSGSVSQVDVTVQQI